MISSRFLRAQIFIPCLPPTQLKTIQILYSRLPPISTKIFIPISIRRKTFSGIVIYRSNFAAGVYVFRRPSLCLCLQVRDISLMAFCIFLVLKFVRWMWKLRYICWINYEQKLCDYFVCDFCTLIKFKGGVYKGPFSWGFVRTVSGGASLNCSSLS